METTMNNGEIILYQPDSSVRWRYGWRRYLRFGWVDIDRF